MKLACCVVVPAVLLFGCGPKGPEIAGRPFSEWLSELSDSDAGTRRRAAQNIANGGAAAEPAIPQLISMLADRDETVRPAAANALVRIGKGSLPELTKAIKSEDRIVRCGAAVALHQLDSKNAAVVPALLEAAAAGRAVPQDFRAYAHEALGRISPEAVPALIDGLKHSDIEIRRRAAYGLGEYGPAARAAVPLLRQMAADRSDELGMGVAIRSLNKITGSNEQFTEKR
jgi:HEAT repeat protein